MSSNWLHYLFVTAVLLTAYSCSDDDEGTDPAPSPNLLAILKQQPELQIYAEALDTAGINIELQQKNLSLFAPTDSAFNAYFQSIGVTNLNGWIELTSMHFVRQTLLYHLVTEQLPDLAGALPTYLRTAAESNRKHPISIYMSIADTAYVLNHLSHSISASTETNNGKIFKVNAVLSIPTLISLLEFNPDFDLMLQSLEAASGSLTAVLRQENNSFTLFAPTNQGFQNYFQNHPDFDSYSDFVQFFTKDELRNIMQYHLLSTAISAEDLVTGSYNTLLSGQSFSLERQSSQSVSITTSSGSEIQLKELNIFGVNGVIHSIDYVLIP